jgi:hypothetical protein
MNSVLAMVALFAPGGHLRQHLALPAGQTQQRHVRASPSQERLNNQRVQDRPAVSELT